MPTEEELSRRAQVHAMSELIGAQLGALPLSVAVDVFREVSDAMCCLIATALEGAAPELAAANAANTELRQALERAENALALARANAVHS